MTGEAPTARIRRPRARWTVRLVVGALLVAAVLVGGTAFRVWQVARVDDTRQVDAIVVLGAAQYDGEPSSIFSWRLRHAQELYADGVAPVIVTTGGSRVGDATTEADAGRDYLVERGVPADAVLAIGEGSDTLGSLRAVAATGTDWDEVVLVSDPWHSLRSRTMARDLGLDAWTSPTRSGPVVQTRATQVRYILRETAALLFYRLTHASVDAGTSGSG
ncbi:MAG: EpiH/GdmH-related protein [uncultured Pseudonocardia sp.]|uniref:EpiH/GdmH-related protein n=1 Tax=uncultured Pseudonocardia sp. TaxID=211455 RepID=A0A6J4PD56_9PSEU|nr:MAG: EpiH/GdmH-related protein [uncultured Pseudonocardia sp.]